MIERYTVGRIESTVPGAAATLIGEKMYAQIAYFDASRGRWNTSNAVEIEFTN